VAAIELATSPSRYGTVEAKVDTVTADAVNDEKRGAIVPATLTLQQAIIDIEGKCSEVRNLVRTNQTA